MYCILSPTYAQLLIGREDVTDVYLVDECVSTTNRFARHVSTPTPW